LVQIEERRRERGGTVVENPETVGYRNAVAVPVNSRQKGEFIVRGMRDQHHMMIGIQRPVLPDKVKEVWHLLQIRRNVGIIATKVNVVEDDLDHMLDSAAGGVKPARVRARNP
jgi:hypothetical protein